MEQLSLYPDYRGVSHWHDDVEFIMMMDGQMTYDINGQSMTCRPGKVSLSTADACTMDTQNKNVENSYDLLSLTAMIGVIQKNYPGKLLLKDISSAGSCCKTKCTSLFQRYLSVSPMQYLNNYRLENGCAMLRNSSMSVTDVTYAYGFSGTSYFCELFHSHYGITPNEYRKENL